MTVNVYRYYENQLAAKREASRPVRPWRHERRRRGPQPWYSRRSFAFSLLGAVIGEALWLAGWPDKVPPVLTLSLLMGWGFVVGYGLDWGFFRLRRILGAVTGDYRYMRRRA